MLPNDLSPMVDGLKAIHNVFTSTSRIHIKNFNPFKYDLTSAISDIKNPNLEEDCASSPSKDIVSNSVLSCEQCDKTFISMNSLNRHYGHLHKKRNQIKEEYLNMSDDEAIAQYLEESRKDFDEFDVIYNNLMENFGVPITPKVHTIVDHFIDYIVLTGSTLGESNDQVIEAFHQDFNRRMTDSNYKVKNKTSFQHGKKLLEAVLHSVTYNCM